MLEVYISGFSGFVGQNLNIYLLRTGISANVLALDFRKNELPELEKESVIIHLAGKSHDIKNTSNPDEYYEVNFELTKKVYDIFLMSEAEKFIFISSVKAVKDQIEGELIEDIIPDPQTHYGKSKLMAEQYILSQPLPDGKSYYILRPCMIHGPGNKGNLNLLYKFISKGLPYPLAAFENKRSFLSIENLCFIIKELMKRADIPSGIYNVADDEPLSTNEVVGYLSEALEKPPSLLRIPKNLIKIIAGAGDILSLPLNTERLNKLTESYIVSNKKIKQVLKKKLPLSSREGIIRTARSFKDV